MAFTDTFIKRPVLATVVSLVILLLGLRSATDLSVRQFPEIQNAQISITTTYVGADADLVEGFITTPLEREIASAEGIDYLVSSSRQSVSTINAYLRLDTDPGEALTQISTKVNKLRNELPEGSEDPVVQLAESGDTASMYLSFYSDVLAENEVTDYVLRVVEPQLTTLEGIQRANVLSSRQFAMRIWLQPQRLAAFNLTAGDVRQALQANNFLAAVGQTKGSYVQVNLTANTDLRTAEEFRQLAIRSDGSSIVRLGDVARVELGAEDYNTLSFWNGDRATFIGIEVAPDANVLDVMKRVRDVWPSIVDQLPEGMSGTIAYDATEYIEDAIDEVISTLIEAVLIVVIVIYLFLGSIRSVLIPAVTVPLSLVGTLFVMLLFGFSINLLTLLAMVLAIGMVVDDAIIVLENVYRHVEDGMKPFDAAIKGARELVGPIVAMTTTLVAVYLPIGFLGGLTGKLFTEFAFTLAGSVLLSGVVALTLSPMMCAKLLKARRPEEEQKGFAAFLDRNFERLRLRYRSSVSSMLDTKIVVAIFGAVVLVSCYFLFVSAPSELAPAEDSGFAVSVMETDPFATIDYFGKYAQDWSERLKQQPAIDRFFMVTGFGGMNNNSGFAGIMLKSYEQRDVSTTDLVNNALQAAGSQVPGMQVQTFQPPSLPTAGQGIPIEFVIGTTQSQRVLYDVVQDVLSKARESRKFIFIDSNLKYDRPQTRVEIDRDKAAALGLDMTQIGGDLASLLSGGYVNRFAMENRSYKVIPQVERSERLNSEQLKDYYTRARDGSLVPLSTFATLSHSVQPQVLNRFQQLNAATVSGMQRPGIAIGDAIATLEQIARETIPSGFSIDYAGQSRQFKNEGSALLLTFAFAIIIIYLVLAAQFESFRDPVIMLVTVPMSICGALIFINLLGLFWVPGASINIYTQVGLVTLIGVIAKHGILIVEFANQLQVQGYDKRKAIEEAASIRLRPILMTTAALVIAMVPLLIASGAGGVSRFAMGLTIASGMTIGTLFTLYVVPTMYMYLGRDHSAAEA